MVGKDKFTPAERSAIMARVRSRNTTPERIVRSALHRLGYRFRLHSRQLPGNPDVIFPSRRIALFVHGCFWHRHQGCRRGVVLPVARQDYWSRKFQRTVARDKANQAALEQNGWIVLVVWECQLKGNWILEVRRALDAAKLRPARKFRAKVDSSF
jgi:DNA mismatch endonuclease (patch repair protein)